ncbi:MAG: hypothetical protein Q7K42_03500 [Candidatus Diapherotrites archaeon]|nr:hypothetical protein [Candidatus Diapherotrites archaeon]
MNIFDEFYYNELTDESFKELVNFAKWMNKFFSHYPLIVGGWAAWCYHKSIGSRDIDVIFLSPEIRDKTLNHYFFYNGYKKENKFGLTTSFVKTIKTSKKEENIIIDAATKKDKPVYGRGIRVNYETTFKNVKKIKIDKNAFIYIPIPELLLAYKIGAVLGRTKTLETTLEQEYFESKIQKDILDIIGIIQNTKLSTDKIKKFIKEIKATKYLKIFFEELEKRQQILQQQKITLTEIKNLLTKTT